MPEPWIRRVLCAAIWAAIGGTVGCDLPNAVRDLADHGTPRFETRFAMPAPAMAFGAADLLPDFITESDTHFSATIAENSATRKLSSSCPACVPLHGQNATKPAFTDTMIVVAAMPDEVIAASLAGGVAQVEFTHDYGFDPLRPGPGASGWITVTVTSGDLVVGSVTIDEPFPSGATIVRDVPIAQGQVSGVFLAIAVLHSPAGETTFLDTNRMLSVTFRPLDIMIDEVTVRVEDRSIDVEGKELDLSDIHESLRERVRRGAIHFAIDNPFDIAGNLAVRVAGNGQEIVREISVNANQTSDTWQSVALSQSDFELVMGEQLNLTLSGSVDAPPGGVVVRPGQEVRIEARVELDVVLGLGGEAP